MANGRKTSDEAMARVRLKALEEAAAEARHMAHNWRAEAEGTHSAHHSNLRRTWAEGAERVADAIAALAGRGSGDGPG